MSPATHHDLLRGLAFTCLVLGGFALANAVRQWRGARAASSWPVVPGVVRHAGLKKGRTLGVATRNSGAPGVVVYRAQVIYAYRVGGQHHEARRIRFGSPPFHDAKGKASMQAVVDRYPVDTAVQVHHHPQRPDEAVLELGLDPFWRRVVVFTAVMLVLALVLGVASWLG
ncbi:MAG TPA: DUF3592 domain-containing protein [Burkholderiaceae bacterium]|nr:DUF3592 domain-containing protein [Burkholderiaceae bacterium]